MAVNHLADLTKSEIKRMRGYRNTGFNSKFIYKPSLKDLPSETNWRLRGTELRLFVGFLLIYSVQIIYFYLCYNVLSPADTQLLISSSNLNAFLDFV